MNPRELLLNTVTSAVIECYGSETEVGDIAIVYAESKFGDFSTNAAFKLSQHVGKKPMDIAKELADSIAGEDITDVSLAEPGFINIALSEGYWIKYLDHINEDYASSKLGKGKQVQVEFISANPTGPLTLGNARGGFVGDVLSNILASQGYKVTREYYFNDAGTQITRLVESYKDHRTATVGDQTPYKGAYMEEVSKAVALVDNEEELKKRLTSHIFSNYINPALKSAKINFDVFTNEGDISRKFDKVNGRLKSEGLIEEREGATWLKTSTFGDSRDRVLVKSSGDRTYLCNDIAYHYDVFVDRGFDKAIKVWGADHAGQIPSLQLTVERLFPGKELEFVIVQWVRLIRDGKEFKISKRAGSYVTVDELIERVGADVARWFMLTRSNDTHIDLDLDLAQDQSQKNPYWYVMYAYVRLRSIMREAKQRGLKTGPKITNLGQTEKELVKAVSGLPELVRQVSENYEVHKLTFFAQQIAGLFHDWYEQTRVVELDSDRASEKLYFLTKLELVFAVVFQLLDVEPRDEM